MTTHSPLRSCETFLLSGDIHPSGGRERWAKGAPALVQVGIRFDAVQIPAALVEACASVPSLHGITEAFREAGITRSVIVSRSRVWYYVLVPPGTDRTWRVEGVRCLGTADEAPYLSVPHPASPGMPGAHWLLPAPDGVGALCDPRSVRALLRKEAHP